jgi:hypothetical protein
MNTDFECAFSYRCKSVPIGGKDSRRFALGRGELALDS